MNALSILPVVISYALTPLEATSAAATLALNYNQTSVLVQVILSNYKAV